MNDPRNLPARLRAAAGLTNAARAELLTEAANAIEGGGAMGEVLLRGDLESDRRRLVNEAARLRFERDEARAERDRLIAMWPGSTSHCVYHDPSDGKWRANDGNDVPFKSLEAAVRHLTGLGAGEGVAGG